MRTALILLFFTSVLLLAACGDVATNQPGNGQTATQKLGCKEFASIPTKLGQLSNNVWNKRAAGAFRWRQCLEQRTVDGQIQYGWSWSWPPHGTTVYAYPEIIVGAKPWEPGPGNDARFPRRIADIRSLVVSYAVETQATGAHNLAASIWLIRTPTVANPPITSDVATEIMVWSDYTPATFVPAGTKRGEVQIDGTDWEVWAAKDWGDKSGANQNRWTYVAYRAKNPTRTISYDARKLLADAIARGLATPDLYVANVELGNEIISGSGHTWIRAFSVTMECDGPYTCSLRAGRTPRVACRPSSARHRCDSCSVGG